MCGWCSSNFKAKWQYCLITEKNQMVAYVYSLESSLIFYFFSPLDSHACLIDSSHGYFSVFYYFVIFIILCEKIFFTLLKPIDMRWDWGGGGV